jgi:DNA-binding NtrC family response regulator
LVTHLFEAGSLVDLMFTPCSTALVQTVSSLRYAEGAALTNPSAMHSSIRNVKQGGFANLLIPFNDDNLLANVRVAVAKRDLKKRQRKRSLLKRSEDRMVSATLAESGSFDAARHFLRDNRDPGPKGKKGAG